MNKFKSFFFTVFISSSFLFAASPTSYLCLKCKFDTNLTSLPKSFLGHNIKEVYKETIVIPKSEFETTEHYNSRIKSQLRSVYAFVTKVGADYEADSSRFTILIQTGHTIYSNFTELSEDNYQNAINILINTETTFYNGQNAFGANKLIKRIITNDYSLQMTDEKAPSPGLISICLPPEKAKSAKSNFRLLYVCSTDLPENVGQNEVMIINEKPDPNRNTGYNSKNPTFTDPEDLISYYNTIKVVLKQVWLFDFASGSIYKKYSGQGQELK